MLKKIMRDAYNQINKSACYWYGIVAALCEVSHADLWVLIAINTYLFGKDEKHLSRNYAPF